MPRADPAFIALFAEKGRPTLSLLLPPTTNCHRCLMATLLPKIIVWMMCGTFLHTLRALEQNEYFNFSDVVQEEIRIYRPPSFRVLALAVLLDIPPSAHECNQGQRFFSAVTAINFTIPFSSLSRAHRLRHGSLLKFQLQATGRTPQIFLTLNNVSVTDTMFRKDGAVHSLYLQYVGEIGDYPEHGLVRAGCSGEKWPKE